MPEEEQKLTLQDIVNYTTISTALDSNNPIYVNYALEDYLDSKEDSEKRELEPWVTALRQEILATQSIPDWGARALNNYQRLYLESLQESKISTLIDLAKNIGYESEDFSNIVKPEEKYKDLTQAYKEVAKKEAIAKIDGKQAELTEEEQKLKDKLTAIRVLQEMIEKTITYSFDKRSSNDTFKALNEKYKPQEQQEAA